MASVKLSTLNVSKAIQRLTVKNTRNLMFHLGVRLNHLDDIEAIYHDGEERKVHFVQKWLDLDPDASWEKLISGLKEIQMHALAAEIEKADETVAPTVPAPSSTNASAQGSPAPLEAASAQIDEAITKVKAEIESFEEKFFQLRSDMRVLLSKREELNKDFLGTFCDFILGLPVGKRVIHIKFFRESEDEILEARNIRKLFAILGRYCNYSNYEIIMVIVQRFGNPNLKGRMVEYCGSIKQFEMTTSISVYLRAISARPDGELSKSFIRMAMKINKSTTDCTLYEIRQLKEAMAENAAIHSYCVYVDGVEESSVKVVLRVHPACAELLRAALSPDFMYLYNLADVKIGEDDISHTSPASTLPPFPLTEEDDDYTGDSGMYTGGSVSSQYLINIPPRPEGAYATLRKDEVKENQYTTCVRPSGRRSDPSIQHYASALRQVIGVLESPEVQKTALADEMKGLLAWMERGGPSSQPAPQPRPSEAGKPPSPESGPPPPPIPPRKRQIVPRWFFGRMSEADAEEKLLHRDLPTGTFLVRENEGPPVSYSLSVKDAKIVRHYRIWKDAKEGRMCRCWHPEHFVCTSYQKQLQNTVFVFEEESIFCEKCYERKFAKTCHSCRRLIVGPCITAQDLSWQQEHFVCSHCHTDLSQVSPITPTYIGS